MDARIPIAALAALLVIGVATAFLVGGGPRAEEPPALPAAGSGSGEVTLSSDAAVHPAAAGVLAQLQRYFDAINAGDFAAWQTAVSPERSTEQPEQAWKAAYRSTRDGTIRIDRIDEEAPGSVLVRVRFVSTQDVADAPADVKAPRICWRSTLPMLGNPPRVARTGAGSSQKAPC